MTNKITLRLLAFVFMCQYASVFAWGTTGHRVVAEVAENNLKASTKHKLKKILGKQKLAYWANWPDFIKSDTTEHWKHTETWHYVNVSPQSSKADFIRALQAQEAPTLYTEIKAIENRLKNEKLTKEQKEIELRFLIHLVGDLAQPMHTGRAEDLGGNKIRIKYFGQNTNLHSLWDSKLIDANQYSYTEYAKILDVKTRREKKQLMKGSLEDWLYESHKAANTIYAYTKADQNYTYGYLYRFNSLLEKQLYEGGLHLAQVLNEVL